MPRAGTNPGRGGWFRRAPLLLAPGGCSGNLSALDPAGPAAAEIAALWWAMLAGSAVLFLLVMGLFVLTMLRPGFGSGMAPSRWILWGGLVMPAVVLTALMVVAFAQGGRMLRDAEGEPVFRVEALAGQWEWRFAYPDRPGAEDGINLLHVPAGQTVEIALTSVDVIHSFWVPRLGGKIDAIPGRINTRLLLADAPGRYGGLCAEYCGTGHSRMSFEVEVYDPADPPPGFALPEDAQ